MYDFWFSDEFTYVRGFSVNLNIMLDLEFNALGGLCTFVYVVAFMDTCGICVHESAVLANKRKPEDE